jgi:hypothetical protein
MKIIEHILPFDVLNLILEYDGRIKYIHKERIYVNIISKNDYRYNIIDEKMNKKIGVIKTLNIGGLNFYVDIYYKNDLNYKGLILCKKICDK